MKNTGMISVIVPVYNVERYLYRCIDSILEQSFNNLEIVLVDDGSADNGSTICDYYAQKDVRIKVVHKKNGGLSSARNVGLDLSVGEYLGFVDSDDYIDSDMYWNLYSRIKGGKACFTNCMYVRLFDSGKMMQSRVPHRIDEDISSEQYLEELLLHIGDVSVCTKLFSRGTIGDLRFVDGRTNEDLLFMVELLEKIDNIKFVGKLGYYYYVRDNSISSKYGKSFIDMQKNAMWVLKKVPEMHPNLTKQATRFALYQNMAFLLAIPKSEAIRTNEVYRNALGYIRRNAKRSIFNPYLKAKEKLILIGLAIMPKTVAKVFHCKHR